MYLSNLLKIPRPRDMPRPRYQQNFHWYSGHFSQQLHQQKSLKYLNRYELKESVQKVDHIYLSLKSFRELYYLCEEVLKTNTLLMITYYLLGTVPYVESNL